MASNLNIVNGNDSHKSVSLDNSTNVGIQELNVQKNSSIGLDLLVNKSKTGETGSPKKPEIKEIQVEAPKQNDDFNLDKLLAEESGKNTIESKSNSNLGLNEVKLDDIQEVSLGDDIFKLDSSSSKPEVKVIDSEPVNVNLKPEPTPKPPSTSTVFGATKPKTFAELQNEKFEILCNLERLESRGVKVSKSFNMDSDFDEMKTEYDRIKRKIDVDKSVRFQRKMLVAFVTAIEFLNSKFDPAGVKLDGWSESIHENVNDYDDIFEELHEKYKSKASMAPELRLILMLGGSGFMFHLTQTLFKTSLPGVGDIMKQNPDLMNQFAKAAAGSMGGENAGLGNLMSDLMGGSGGAQREPSRAEMRGPPNIEDILGKVDTTRRTNVEVDNVSNFSESDMEAARNINIRRKRKTGNEITLDF